jgi:hypothetical protein
MNTYTSALRAKNRSRYDRIALIAPWVKSEFDGMLDMSSESRIATSPSNVFDLSTVEQAPAFDEHFVENYSFIALSQRNH